MNEGKLFDQGQTAGADDAAAIEEKAKRLEEQAAKGGQSEWDDFLSDINEDANKKDVAEKMRKGLDPIIAGNVKSYADLVMMEGPKLKSASDMMKDIYDAMVAAMPELGKDSYRGLMAEKIRRAMTSELEKRVADLETSASQSPSAEQVTKNEEAW